MIKSKTREKSLVFVYKYYWADSVTEAQKTLDLLVPGQNRIGLLNEKIKR